MGEGVRREAKVERLDSQVSRLAGGRRTRVKEETCDIRSWKGKKGRGMRKERWTGGERVQGVRQNERRITRGSVRCG